MALAGSKSLDLSRLEAVFHAALELPAAQRAAFLDEACGSDAAMRTEIEALLSADTGGGSLLDGPAPAAALAGLGAPSAAPLPEGTRIARYEITRFLGAGGMGAVYEAIQPEPRRTVALKVLRASFAAPAALRRFRQEIELLGRLQHPCIAQIFEAGLHENGLTPAPFFALELVPDARTLLDFARERGLGLRERLALFLRVCDGVQHGHQRGVVHRDLKPGNVLIGSDGRPKIIDYGVARALDADMRSATVCTTPGEFIGTLQYMAPEQLRADPDAVDTRADIYALGLILFELLTERRPFDLTRMRWTDAIRTIEQTPAPDAGKLRRELRGDLATIIAHALEKDRERRYASVGELAADIRRYLNNEPIAARPASLLVQLQKFAARHRTFVAATVVSAASLVLGAGAALWYAAEANAARERAELSARRMQVVSDFLERILASGEARYLGRDVPMMAALDSSANDLPVTIEEDPAIYAQLQAVLGRAYIRMGETGKAGQHLRAAVAGRRADSKDPTRDECLALALVDSAWEGCTQTLDEQLRQFQEAVDIYTKVGGPRAHYAAATISYMACVELNHDPVSAERRVREAVRQLEASGHTQDGAYAYAQYVLGATLHAQNRLAEAEPPLRLAADMHRSIFGPKNRDLATCLRERASVLDKLGRTVEAEACRREVRTIEPHEHQPG